MSTLIGFVDAPQDATKQAAGLFTIKNGTSPFQNNVELTVTNYSFVVSESIDFANGNKKSHSNRPIPVLVTNIGNLFISCLRDRYKADGELAEADGDLNKKLKELVADSKAMTDGEILQALVKFCKGKKLVVRRSKPFTVLNRFTGREQMTSLVNIDIVK